MGGGWDLPETSRDEKERNQHLEGASNVRLLPFYGLTACRPSLQKTNKTEGKKSVTHQADHYHHLIEKRPVFSAAETKKQPRTDCSPSPCCEQKSQSPRSTAPRHKQHTQYASPGGGEESVRQKKEKRVRTSNTTTLAGIFLIPTTNALASRRPHPLNALKDGITVRAAKLAVAPPMP